MKGVSLLLLVILVSGGFSVAFFAPSAVGSTPTSRLGFWIDERDIWSGVGLCWSASEFVSNYFETSPYPSAMLFATGLQPSGACSTGVAGEATWLSQVASDAQSAGLNAEIIILFFVNLSGGTVDGIADQTAALQSFMSALGSHSNIYGAEYEIEYYGNTPAEEQSFYSIIEGAGYQDILNPGNSVNGFSTPVLGYSEYPYLGGSIPTGLGSGYIGYGYGETGSPSGSTPNPAWTQTTVQEIVEQSPANPYVFLYADDGGSGQPSWQLWNWSTLRQWVWSDPSYQQNYVLSTNSPVTSTNPSTTALSTTTTSSPVTSTTSMSSTATTSTITSSTTSMSSTSTTSSATTSTPTVSSTTTETYSQTTSATTSPPSTTTGTATVTNSTQATTATVTTTTATTTTALTITSSQQTTTATLPKETTTSQTASVTATATTSSVGSSYSVTTAITALNPGAPVALAFTSWINIGLALASGGALALGSLIFLDSRGLVFERGRKSAHPFRFQKRLPRLRG